MSKEKMIEVTRNGKKVLIPESVLTEAADGASADDVQDVEVKITGSKVSFTFDTKTFVTKEKKSGKGNYRLFVNSSNNPRTGRDVIPVAGTKGVIFSLSAYEPSETTTSAKPYGGGFKLVK